MRPGPGKDIRAAISSFRAAVGRVSLDLQDGLDKPRQVMALEFRLNGSGDLVPHKLFKVRAGDNALFVRCPRLHGRGTQGLRLPIIGAHSVDAGFGIIALHPANRHERAEGVEDVLAEVRPRDSLVVRVASREHRDWTTYRIDSHLITPADAWQVTLGIPVDALPDRGKPWAAVDACLGQDVVLTGRIDRIGREVAMGSLGIRDKQHASGHLIECKGRPVERLNTSLATAARRAQLPYPIWPVRHSSLVDHHGLRQGPGALAMPPSQPSNSRRRRGVKQLEGKTGGVPNIALISAKSRAAVQIGYPPGYPTRKGLTVFTVSP